MKIRELLRDEAAKKALKSYARAWRLIMTTSPTVAVGLDIFVYKAQDGFKTPAPGIVTGVYPNAPGILDAEVFFPKRSTAYHTEALEHVPFAIDEQEARQHFAKGAKVVAGPRDGTAPKPFADAPDPAPEVEDENLADVRRMASAGEPLIRQPKGARKPSPAAAE